MIGYLSRRYELSASHRLYCPDLDADANAALFGKCANPHGHGHNYRVQVCVSGQIDPVRGMVCDLVLLDACVQRAIVAEYDHTNLNLHPDFRAQVPTTENFCIALYARLCPLLAGEIAPAVLAEVTIEETSNNSFVYAGGGPAVEAKQWKRAHQRAREGEAQA